MRNHHGQLVLQFLLPFLWNDSALLAFCICTKTDYVKQKANYICFVRNRIFTKHNMTIKMCAFAIHELFSFRVGKHEQFWNARIIGNDLINPTNVNSKDMYECQCADDICVVAQFPSYKSHCGIQWDTFSSPEERLQIKQRCLLDSPWSLAYHAAHLGSFDVFENLSQKLIDLQQLRGLAFVTACIQSRKQYTPLFCPTKLKFILNRRMLNIIEPPHSTIKYTTSRRKFQFV